MRLLAWPQTCLFLLLHLAPALCGDLPVLHQLLIALLPWVDTMLATFHALLQYMHVMLQSYDLIMAALLFLPQKQLACGLHVLPHAGRHDALARLLAHAHLSHAAFWPVVACVDAWTLEASCVPEVSRLCCPGLFIWPRGQAAAQCVVLAGVMLNAGAAAVHASLRIQAHGLMPPLTGAQL